MEAHSPFSEGQLREGRLNGKTYEFLHLLHSLRHTHSVMACRYDIHYTQVEGGGADPREGEREKRREGGK